MVIHIDETTSAEFVREMLREYGDDIEWVADTPPRIDVRRLIEVWRRQ